MVNVTVKWVLASLIVLVSLGVLIWFFIWLHFTNKNEPIPPIRRLSRPRFSIHETSLSHSVTYSPIISPSPSPIGFEELSSRSAQFKALRPEINLGLDLTETDDYLPDDMSPNPNNSTLPEPTRFSHSLDRIALETSNTRKLVKPYPLKRQATFPLSDECQVPYAPFGRRTSYSSPSSDPYPPASSSAFYPPVTPSAPPAGQGSCSSLPPPPSYKDVVKRKF